MSAGEHFAEGPRHPSTCLACGADNPAGMGLRLRVEDRRAFGEVTLDARQEGAPGYAHGGVIATLLDDTLGMLPPLLDWPAVTGRLEVDFRAPALIGRRYETEAWIERVEGRKVHVAGEMRDDAGCVAEGRAIFIRVETAHFVHGARARTGEDAAAASEDAEAGSGQEQLPW